MRTWPRIVLHADMDAFYAAVEQMDDPSLRGKPILIGSDSGRGVVMTASYEARPFGVGSAMPMARARRMCPDAVIVPPRFERYVEISKAVMETFADFSPDIEPISLDEAFLEMTGATGIFGDPTDMGQQLKAAVKEATGGLTVSVGASGTKYVAKVASDYRKPDGLTIVPPTEAREFLAPLPVSRLWGAGPITCARLESLGFRWIGQLAEADPDDLQAQMGNMGPHFWRLSRALDPRRVRTGATRRSVGSSRTLAKDIRQRADIELHLRRSAESIGRRLRRKHLRATGVRVKLKTSSFKLMTRQQRLRDPTDVGQKLYEAGVELLGAFEYDEAFRLVGMAAYDLIGPKDPVQLGLFASGRPSKRRQLEEAMDSIRTRFGHDAVERAENLDRGAHWGEPNLDYMDDTRDG